MRLPSLALALIAASCGGHLAATDDAGAEDAGAPDSCTGVCVHPQPIDGGPPVTVDAAPPHPIAHYGYVVAETFGSPAQSAGVATFDPAASPECAFARPELGCAIVQCTTSAASPLSAGTITLSGGSQPMTLAPQAQQGGFAYQAVTQTPIFVNPQSIVASSTGGDVPPFAAAVTFPPAITITSPPITDGGPLSIDTSVDLPLAWNPTPSFPLVMLYAGTNSGPTETALSCWFKGSDGSATVPSSILQAFKAHVSGQASLVVLPLARVIVQAGDWGIVYLAAGPGPVTSSLTLK